MVVEKSSFPFEMSIPEFGVDSHVHDGTVLYLNELLVSDDNTVILKSFAEGDLVHLIASDPVSESGVISAANEVYSSSIVDGFHYYYFPNDIKIYAEYALVVQAPA